MSMGALRQALDARALPTDTPGLKGDARHHALVQRLLNATRTGFNATPAACVTAEHVDQSNTSSARNDSEDSEEDAKSATSSSSYSTAGDFLFYDLPSTRSSEQLGQRRTTKEPEAGSRAGQSQRQRLKRDAGILKLDERSAGSAWGAAAPPPSLKQTDDSKLMLELPIQAESLSNATFDRRRKLVELRRQLHELRVTRHRRVQERMREHGFSMTLDELSEAIETLEHERQRILHSFFAHELVTSSVLSQSGSTPMELVQEDAVALIEKRQERLKKLSAQTKEGFSITKQQLITNQETHLISVENERKIIETIRQLEEDLHAQSARDFESDGYSSRSDASFTASQQAQASISSVSVLTRCRSVPNNMFLDAWNELNIDQRQQLHHELRSAASFRMKRGRVLISDQTPRIQVPNSNALLSPRTMPSQADRLGTKALFLEQSDRKNLVEANRIYLQALALDPDHATNLGNYALFLYRSCRQMDQAQAFFERALAADPTHARNLGSFANFLKRERQDFDQAEALYQRAIRAAPRDVNAMINYANLFKITGQSQKCKQLLEQALRITPHHVQSRLQLASVLLELGRLKEAEQCYQELLTRLDIRLDVSQRDETLQQQQRARHERAHIYGNYANCLAKQARYNQAKAMYIKAMDLHPHDALLTRNL